LKIIAVAASIERGLPSAGGNCRVLRSFQNRSEGAQFELAVTVQKLLDRSERRLMQFLTAFQQAEMHTKLSVDGVSFKENNIQAATLRGPLRPEGTNDDVASQLHGVRSLAYIRLPLGGLRQEMKGGTVVPHVVCGSR